MYSTITIHLLFWFILATLFFYLALQQPFNYLRQILTILHILSIAICLRGDDLGLVPFAHVWVTFIFGITLHTTSILVIKKKIIKLQPFSFIRRLRTTFQTWTNFRQLPLDHEDAAIPAQNSTSRGNFTALKCAHIVALYFGYHLVTSIISKTLRPQHYTSRLRAGQARPHAAYDLSGPIAKGSHVCPVDLEHVRGSYWGPRHLGYFFRNTPAMGSASPVACAIW